MDIDSNTEFYRMDGPILLLAGPGTGKTYQLAKRIRFLVEDRQVPPDQIAVITFTDAAARNMRSRISDPKEKGLYVPREKQPKLICTMHSIGDRILHDSLSNITAGKRLRIVDSDHLREVLAGDAAQLVGSMRSESDNTLSCRRNGHCTRTAELKCNICGKYEEILASCDAIDFDGQILLACRHLKDKAGLLAAYQQRCTHLLVDEYQDINYGQFELVQLLSEKHRAGLFVVGDDDQSIYSWRGGSPEFVRDFGKHFGPDASVQQLVKSWRCNRNILEGALAIVQHYDEHRVPKKDFTYDDGEGPKIVVHNVASDEKEASQVVKIVKNLSPGDKTLILVPHREFLAAVLCQLEHWRIPYTLRRKQPGEGIPLLLELCNWLSDCQDSLALRQCLECWMNRADLKIPGSRSSDPKKVQERENKFGKISGLWRDVMNGKCKCLWQALTMHSRGDDLLQRCLSELEKLIELDKDKNSDFPTEALRTIRPWKNRAALFSELWAWARAIQGTEGSNCQIMTFHSAKGLEADTVCIVGMEEGVIPRKKASQEEIEEQSRLIYVAMTRAKRELHIFHARKRSQKVVQKQVYEAGNPPDLKASPFIDAIPKQYLERKLHWV